MIEQSQSQNHSHNRIENRNQDRATPCNKTKCIKRKDSVSSSSFASCQSINSQPISASHQLRQDSQQHQIAMAFAGGAVEHNAKYANHATTILDRNSEKMGKNKHVLTQKHLCTFTPLWRLVTSSLSSTTNATMLLVTLITLMPPTFITKLKMATTGTSTTNNNHNLFWFAEAQCGQNMMTTFERITGVTVKGSPMVTLYNALTAIQSGTNQSLSGGSGPTLMPSQLMNQRQQNSAFNQVALAPITAECNNRCRKNTRCRAFLVDYEKHTCHGVEQLGNQQQQNQQSASALARSPPPIVLVPTQDRTSYFEKVCVQPVTACERAWLFERVPSYHIINYDNKIIENVQNRLKCQELCLSEKDFRCRSGEYDYITEQCRLSIQDRHSRPDSFRPAPSNIDYFENQCASDGASCDTFDR